MTNTDGNGISEHPHQNNHIVILGYNKIAQVLIQELVNAKQKVSVLTEEQNLLEKVRTDFSSPLVYACQGVITDRVMLDQLYVKNSIQVLVNAGNDEDSLLTILKLKKMYQGLNFVVMLENEELKETFESAGVSYVVSKESVNAKVITSYMYEDDVAETVVDLMEATKIDDDHDMQQYLICSNNPYIGKTYGELFWYLKDELNVLLTGVQNDAGRESDGEIHLLPDQDKLISEGAYVFVITDAAKEPKLEELFGVSEGIKM